MAPKSKRGGQSPAAPRIFSRIFIAKVKAARQLRDGVDAKWGPGTAESVLREVRQEEEAWEARQLATLAPTESEHNDEADPAEVAELAAIMALFRRLRKVASIFRSTLRKKEHEAALKEFMEPGPMQFAIIRRRATEFVRKHLPGIKEDFELIAKNPSVWSRIRKPKPVLHAVAVMSTAAAMGLKPKRVREVVGRAVRKHDRTSPKR